MILITLIAQLNVEHRETAVTAAQKMSAHALAEPGCLDYRFWISDHDPDTVLLLERWESQEALDTHMATPQLAEFSAAFVPALAGGVEATKYQIATSGPLF
jgi:quinol monooxygenase YgiN